jgi:hypothetical protein
LTPFEGARDVKQIANFLLKLKAEGEGNATPSLPILMGTKGFQSFGRVQLKIRNRS